MKRWIVVVSIAACLILATVGSGAAATEKLDVPSYLQTDSRWSSDIMGQPGNCGATLGSAGCAVTSTAMVFKYYGVQTDPKDLNNWLRENNGYSSCLIKWSKAAEMTGGGVKYVTMKYNPTEDSIISYLSSGVPLIADLNGHFEVITGYAGSSYYYVNDPMGKDTKIAFSKIKRVIIYKGTIVAEPAQILTQSISPTSVSPKGKLTFVFNINNPNSDSIKNVRLGAQIRTNNPQGAWIDDPSNDKIVTLSPGTKDYSRTFTVPQSASPGYYDARWVILDDKTGTWIDSETMTRIFEVKTQSQPPVLSSIGDKSVYEKEKLSFSISAKDPDGDKVTYSAEGLPSGARLSSSGIFTWTPGSGTAGKYIVKFIATANGQTDSETITITVNNPLSTLPEVTSITPSKTAAGTFDLTIKGKNFNSKTAVEMIYFDGRYVGQGTIKSRSSTKIVVTEKMTGATPGVYVIKIRNNPSDPSTESNGKDLTITAVPVTLSVSPASGKQGTTFSFTGNGYTPNGKIEWHVRKPDNTEFPVATLTASSSGTLSYTYKSNSGSMIGTYIIWAVDKATGRISNEVKEKIK